MDAKQPPRTSLGLQIASLMDVAREEIAARQHDPHAKTLELFGMHLVQSNIPEDAKGWHLTEEERRSWLSKSFSQLARHDGEDASHVVSGARRALLRVGMPEKAFDRVLRTAIRRLYT